jgi:Domain of unknown function (DUF4129)
MHPPVLSGAVVGNPLQSPLTVAVRDTIASVFSQRAYDRTVGESLWDRFVNYVLDLLTRIFQVVGTSKLTRPIVIAILAILVLLVVSRIAIAVRTAALTDGPRRVRGHFGRRMDPWAEAQRLAAAHQYTDAAHALYAALLDGVARREDLRVHPSKTVGDYLRELRRRSSTLIPSFRDFARLYEVVVYGLGVCDRERYERLHALAVRMMMGDADVAPTTPPT